MALTTEQREKVRAVLLAKATNPCPGCGHRDRFLAPDLVLVQNYEPNGRLPIGAGQPCIATVCRHCGSVQMFNIYVLELAEILGIRSSQETSGKS